MPSPLSRRYILPSVPPKGVTARVPCALKYAYSGATERSSLPPSFHIAPDTTHAEPSPACAKKPFGGNTSHLPFHLNAMGRSAEPLAAVCVPSVYFTATCERR